MNETTRLLRERKSVRVFEDREIPASIKSEIIESAMAAPSAGNQQLYTILDITDPDLKAKLSESCDRQPFIAKAPMVLVFCADAQKWYDLYLCAGAEPRKPGAGDLMLAAADSFIAAQNAVTAAWSLGIGSCYIGDVMEQCQLHRAVLNLPEYVFPAAMVVFGYPSAGQLARVKPERCSAADIVCENTYRRKNDEELRKMFEKDTRGKPFEEWVRAFCARKYNSDFSREMTRSVEEYLKSFR